MRSDKVTRCEPKQFSGVPAGGARSLDSWHGFEKVTQVLRKSNLNVVESLYAIVCQVYSGFIRNF